MIEVDQDRDGVGWCGNWRDRVTRWYEACSGDREWVEPQVRLRVSLWDDAEEKHLFRITGGWLALVMIGSPSATAQVADVWIEPDQRWKGLGRAALGEAMKWAAGRAARFGTSCPAGDPAVDALFAPMPVRATGMIKTLAVPPAVDADVGARPMTREEYPSWAERNVAWYAREMVDAGMFTDQEALERSRQGFEQRAERPGHGGDRRVS
jgi:GNAT superfamily N-acetyltransferase